MIPRLLATAYLITLWLGYIAIGWLLAAWRASPWIIGLSGVMVLYLGKAGMGGLVLVNMWVLILMAWSAAFKVWFSGVFLPYVPQYSGPLWASFLLLLWTITLLLVLGLAQGKKPLILLGVSPRFIPYALGLGGLSALIIGQIIYHQFTPHY
ncbi:hypothetical protein K4A83_20955 [Spirulina subsalsa FACHB-351]|uniref:Uncharacterized protein n=1 Tax=Spirulina subsalsa FACHB-351 TaxID=234711 RepID=A0ABT3LB32_9CYAN|nr:hypothetical protein [Spirulina subsalsa]MCW6038722.1 hypothetical protein [Spirulina subsalsa FACHB-351]